MNRRHALRFAISASVATGASPLWAQGTAAGLRRVGVLAPSTRAKVDVTLRPFFDETHRLGWVEGQTIGYDRVYADDRQLDLPRLAAEPVINLKTAKVRGITIRQALLLRADEVIQ